MIKSFLTTLVAGGLGIREIAKITGLPSSTIHRLYSGKTEPNIITAQKILTSFGYKLDIAKI